MKWDDNFRNPTAYVNDEQRDEWARELLSKPDARSIHSGDSIVLQMRDGETGSVEIYDCLVRRSYASYRRD